MMQRFKVTNSEGAVARFGVCAADMVSEQATQPGETAIAITAEEFDALNAPPAPAPVTVESLRAELLAFLAQRRWEVETAGIEIGGTKFETDDRSKLLISGAADKARRNPSYTTLWKTSDGWITIDADTILAAYDAVFAHVEACFVREGVLVAQIQAAETLDDLEELAPVIDAFWPADE